MIPPILRIGLSLIVIFLAGCALHEIASPPPVLPPVFAAPSASGEKGWVSEDWYAGFASAELQSFIKEAASGNLDIGMAQARVLQADARARQAGAAILPHVDLGANGNYLAGHSHNDSAHETDWATLLSVSYEMDFWGKQRAAVRSANAMAAATLADHDTVVLTSLAAIADGYFQILSLRERLSIATSNRDTAKELLDIIRARFAAGMATPIELALQKSTLTAAGMVVPELQQQESEALAALAILLGRDPEHFAVEARSLDAVVEPMVAVGLPSQLLTRRPDIFMAEANMRAANADLVVARAALLPSLTLTVEGGVQNPALNAAVLTLNGVGPTLNLGAALAQPIFDGGRLRAVRTEVQAKDEELVLAYRAAILAALRDVENALGELQHLNELRLLQEESLTQSVRTFEGVSLRYQHGSGDFLSVLEAQRTLYVARDQYSQYKLARLRTVVTLCKALGGGWQTPLAQRSIQDIR